MYELTSDVYQKLSSQWGEMPSQGCSHPSLTHTQRGKTQAAVENAQLHDKWTRTGITAQMLTNKPMPSPKSLRALASLSVKWDD